jgi:hypothetical protein
MRRKSGHIRDCPEGRDGTKEDGENRIAYEFSHTSALLTELRCAVGPLCDALGCYETDVAALKYAAPPKGSLDVGRQPLHRDFNPECIARLREKVRRKGLRIEKVGWAFKGLAGSGTQGARRFWIAFFLYDEKIPRLMQKRFDRTPNRKKGQRGFWQGGGKCKATPHVYTSKQKPQNFLAAGA